MEQIRRSPVDVGSLSRFLPRVYRFYTSQVIFSPDFWTINSMPITMAVFFFRAQKSQTTTVWMVLKPSLIMGFQLPFPQLVFVYRISESSTWYVSEVPQTENSKTVEIPNMKLTLTERPRMAHTKTTSRGAGLRPVSNRSFDSESWTKKQL